MFFSSRYCGNTGVLWVMFLGNHCLLLLRLIKLLLNHEREKGIVSHLFSCLILLRLEVCLHCRGTEPTTECFVSWFLSIIYCPGLLLHAWEQVLCSVQRDVSGSPPHSQQERNTGGEQSSELQIVLYRLCKSYRSSEKALRCVLKVEELCSSPYVFLSDSDTLRSGRD